MVTSLRRGLPRVSGGDAWPPENTALPPTQFVLAALSAPTESAPQSETGTTPVPTDPAPVASGAGEPASPVAPAAESAPATFRRGLPRVAGGEPWPAAEAIPADVVHAPQPAATAPDTAQAEASIAASDSAPTPVTAAASTPTSSAASGPARRGLPREAGGKPWPPEGTVVSAAFAAAPVATVASPVAPTSDAKTAPPQPEVAVQREPLTAEPAAAPAPPTAAQPAAAEPAKPVVQPAAQAAAHAPKEPKAKVEPARYGPFTIKQWVGAGAVIALAIVGAVTLVVLATRWFLGFDFMTSFMASYPGKYDLPESAPVGFPGWLGWQHFFNVFLILLIIRSGLQVRNQERPEAYWASKRNPKKISINLWLHQGLNILWVVNGAIFVILLFATGQWMRVIPTSIDVFPNAISAMLQYLSLSWPLDNGWVNYNSLQQLAYFATIFIAAPLSAISGYRMSESWPKESKLSEKFPVQWARAVHFPVMIYFVAFIVVHVALVFTTGALKNLNHMYAAQGSVDPSVYATNWVGFWMFIASMVVIVGAWLAARPLIMAPIARIFGNVTAR